MLKLLAEECSSPKELIDSVLRLKGMTKTGLAEIINLDPKHVHVALSPNQSLGPEVLYKMTIGLSINPTIVFRNYGDWILKKQQEKYEK
jgi:hypothetical protein